MIRLLRHSVWLVAIVATAVAVAAEPAEPIRADQPHAEAARRAKNMANGVEAAVEPLVDGYSLLFGPMAELPARQWLGRIYLALDAVVPAEHSWAMVAKLASAPHDATCRADALGRLGDLRLQAGRSEAAHAAASELLALATERHDIEAEAIARRLLGVVKRRSGDLDGALADMQRGLALARETGSDVLVGLALNSLGSLYRDRGDFAKALEIHLEALDVRLRSGDRIDTSYRNIALLYREIEDVVTVRDYLDRAMEAALRHGNPLAFSPILGSYAVLLNDEQDHAAALAAAEQGLEIDRLMGNRSSIGFNQIERGRALIGLGRPDEGMQALRSALATGRELGLREIVARALLPMVEQALAHNDADAAQPLLEEATRVVEAAQLRPQLAQAYALRERLAVARGDLAAALLYLQRYGEERELLLGTRASRQLAALKVRGARVESEHALTLLQKDNELQAIRLRAQALEQRLTILGSIALALLAALAFWRYAGTRRLNENLRRKNGEIEAQRAALSEVNERLQVQAKELYAASIHDGLTGSYNRGYLIHHLNDAVQAALSGATELSVLMVDFDHFKAINDSRGHLYGDAVLVTAVQAMAEALGPSDLLARYGGEEFVVVLDRQDIAAATTTAELLRRRVEQALARFDSTGRASTISIGVASLSRLPLPSMDNLLDAADRAVYRAKALGRNRVVIADAQLLAAS